MRIEQLFAAVNEKDVETFWKAKLLDLYPDGTIKSPNQTDGIFEDQPHNLKVIFEFKYDLNLKDKIDQCKPLIQALFYLKVFETKGEKFPKVVFIADKNEAFALHTNPLLKYLDTPGVNWKQPASTAYKTEQALLMKLVGDEQINPYVFDVKKGDFNFRAISNKINDLNENVKRLIKITDQNLLNVFEDFSNKVIKEKNMKVNELANLFVQILINSNGNYLHPRKKNILVSKDYGELKVDDRSYTNFFEHFDGSQYSYREKKELTAVVDRLIEDETRRRKGEFFTPQIWANEAMKMIEEVFGADCREKNIFWDPAAGTMNLTRDYQFKELYCSTIEQSDIDTANQMGYNKDAVKFQYDFLNDGIIDGKIDVAGDPKLPEGLKKAILDGKEIIVFMNPPYATSSNMNFDRDDTKSGVAKTKMNDIMLKNKMGKSASQLYAQFLYRLILLKKYTNIKIGCFAPPLYFTGNTFEKFRKDFFKEFSFCDGMLFEASNFADVDSSWGISFSILDGTKYNLIIELPDGDKLKIQEDGKNIIVNDSKKDIQIIINNPYLLNQQRNNKTFKKFIQTYKNYNKPLKVIYNCKINYAVLSKIGSSISSNTGDDSEIVLNWYSRISKLNKIIGIKEEERNVFSVKALNKNFLIEEISKKDIYNLDNKEPLSDWIRKEIKNKKDVELFPHMSSALTISQNDNQKLIKGSLGSFCSLANSIYKNNVGVSILTSIQTQGNAKIALSILPENFNKICSCFTARKTIQSNWINQKDEYMAPNESHPDYPQWNNDAIVYSLFNTSSNQSSMRQVEYKSKLWDIKNEFFFMSKDEMIELADKHKFDELYKDAEFAQDRYVYDLLKNTTLSPYAQEVLNMAKELVRKTFPMRKMLHGEHPEWHLQSWDAGWYQIKLILKEYFKDDLKEFNIKYKAFEDRMREGVYKFGFLK